MARRTSVYLTDELAEQVDASGAGMAVLIRRGLNWEAVTVRQAAQEAAEAVRDDVRVIIREELRSALADLQGGGSW